MLLEFGIYLARIINLKKRDEWKLSMIHWGMNYIFKDGEIVKARGNDAKTEGAVAAYFKRAKNGIPTLDAEVKGPFEINILRDREDIKSAVEAIDNLNADESKIIANGLEGMLDMSKAIISLGKRTINDCTVNSNIPKGIFYLDKDGKKIEYGEDYIASYWNENNGGMKIEINPEILDLKNKKYDYYRFGLVSSCIKGLNEKHENILELKKVSQQLKEYLKQ